MTAATGRVRDRVLLCDADGCLFPSEGPAYERSAVVLNELLAQSGIEARFTGEMLRLAHTGMNFRTTAARICAEYGVDLSPESLEEWVEYEKDVVTAHLREVLLPNLVVQRALARLAETFRLAVVSSSAAARIDACLEATQIAGYFDESCRFSAEDSLSSPAGKPDPAIYLHAAQAMKAGAGEALAIEDSAPGVGSAVAAGIPVVGLLHFVPMKERAERRMALTVGGATAIAETWQQFAGLHSVPESVPANPPAGPAS